MKNLNLLSALLGLWLTVANSHAADLFLKRIGSYNPYPFYPRGSVYSVAISGTYAYVAANWGNSLGGPEESALQVIDICNPSKPRKVGEFAYHSLGAALDVAVSGNYAYAAFGRDGLMVIDIHDPAHPTLVNRPESIYYTAGRVAVSGNYAYVLGSYSARYALDTIEISDPAHPRRVSSYTITSFPESLAVSGNYAYIAEQYDGVEIVDISNPANPNRVGRYDTNDFDDASIFARAIAVSGDYAYVASGWTGLQVIDISEPAIPKRVGIYLTRKDSFGSANSVVVSGNYLYVGDRYTGLHVFDVTNPANPQRVAGYEVGGPLYDVAVSGDYIYLAKETNHLEIAIQRPTSAEPDVKRPVINITTPRPGARLDSETLMVSGRASDKLGVTQVMVSLENARGISECISATGTSNWAALVTNLAPGLNTLRVWAQDAAGNFSAEVTRKVTFVVSSPLHLTVQGEGSVTPLEDAEPLEIARTYVLTAKPSPGYVFAGWTGDIASLDARLTFAMRSNLTLRANFILNPFLPLKGTYHGLFYPEGAARHEHSGLLTLSVTAAGAYTAKMIAGGKPARFSGRFGLDLRSYNSVVRPGKNHWGVELHLEGDGTMTGWIRDWPTQAVVWASRPAPASPAPQVGDYTVAMPGSDEPSAPEGDSVGTVRINQNGALTFAGQLADGTPVTQRVPLVRDGRWPLYASLHKGAGSIFGWIEFADRDEDDLHGTVIWSRPALTKARFYPDGFVLHCEMTGSLYRQPSMPADLALSFTNGLVSFSGGDLAAPFTNQVILTRGNRVVNLSTNQLKMTLSSASGRITGRFMTPDGSQSMSLSGVVLQKSDRATGFILGPHASGLMQFESAVARGVMQLAAWPDGAQLQNE